MSNCHLCQGSLSLKWTQEALLTQEGKDGDVPTSSPSAQKTPLEKRGVFCAEGELID